MLKIRLQRIGRKKIPVYRIVVIEHTRSVKAAYTDLLGRYSPLANPKVFEVDEAKIATWIGRGAQPSSTLARLLKGKGMKGMERYIEDMPNRQRKKAEEGAPAVPQTAAVPAASA